VQLVLVLGVTVVDKQIIEDGTGGAVREIVTARLAPPRETVTEVSWFEVMASAVNWKLVVVAPCATVAELGTVNTPPGFADTVRAVPPTGAGFEIVAVQFVVEEAANVVLAHCRELRVAGEEVMVSVAVLLTSLREAVRVEV
jgi:hypothetical protein